MKPLLATVHFPDSEGAAPVKALVESLTDAILVALTDGLGQETADQNVQAVVRPLVEGPEGVELQIEGCFDAGYAQGDDEDPEPVSVKRRKDGKFHLEGNGREVLLEVVSWKPSEERMAELRAMSQEDLVLRVLELEAVL